MIKEGKNNLIKLKSASKINLALWIKEKRVDSYHEIETIYFENQELYDDIEIEYLKSNDEIINVCFCQDKLNQLIPADKNLAYKAAKLFFDKLNITGVCNIKINKRIPIEAGLGGGSSNAACVLKGLNELFNHSLHQSELLDFADQIGSDVPFFILGGTCLATGRGEILTVLENKLNLETKIVKPKNISISTKWAYEQIETREFMTDHRFQIDNLNSAMKKKDSDSFFKNTFNDFEMVAFSFYPELINERNKLFKEGYKVVHLCGSGSALFAIRES